MSILRAVDLRTALAGDELVTRRGSRAEYLCSSIGSHPHSVSHDGTCRSHRWDGSWSAFEGQPYALDIIRNLSQEKRNMTNRCATGHTIAIATGICAYCGFNAAPVVRVAEAPVADPLADVKAALKAGKRVRYMYAPGRWGDYQGDDGGWVWDGLYGTDERSNYEIESEPLPAPVAGDPHAHLRQALREGHTIENFHESNGRWYDAPARAGDADDMEFTKAPDRYRIKEPEPVAVGGDDLAGRIAKRIHASDLAGVLSVEQIATCLRIAFWGEGVVDLGKVEWPTINMNQRTIWTDSFRLGYTEGIEQCKAAVRKAGGM